MRTLAVVEFLSLDGVMQAPGAPDEDTEGGFQHGGWALPFHDEVQVATALERMASTDAYLFGRKTYEKMAAYWPTAPKDMPFTDHLNNATKYVASTTLRSTEWQHSTVIKGDVAEEVARLKEGSGQTMAVLGSGELIQTLMQNDLVDEFFLMVCPILLGPGKRLFRDDSVARNLKLVDSKVTTTGTLLLTYRRAR